MFLNLLFVFYIYVILIIYLIIQILDFKIYYLLFIINPSISEPKTSPKRKVFGSDPMLRKFIETEYLKILCF